MDCVKMESNHKTMKKILIVNNNMHIGGVQKALLNLLWSIRDKYDITLLLFYKGGAYLKDIPPEVKVITPNSCYRYLGMTKDDRLCFKDRLVRGLFAGISRVFGRRYAVTIMGIGQKQLGNFDAAISYLHNGAQKAFYGGCNDFVLNHVSADKKIAFLHCDYRQTGVNDSENTAQYGKFDAIAACSKGCGDLFLQACPQYKDKVNVVYNCQMYDRIQRSAEEQPVKLCEDKINIVTVSRISKTKGIDRAISAIGQLEEKHKLHYYIIGDGMQQGEISRLIKENDMQNTVTLCGKMENPYGHVKAADLLLIPSRHEAAPMVINESACLGTPVLSTETSSAYEMIEECGYGWVCENSAEGIREALKKLMQSTEDWASMNKHQNNAGLNNQEALMQFDQIIGE